MVGKNCNGASFQEALKVFNRSKDSRWLSFVGIVEREISQGHQVPQGNSCWWEAPIAMVDNFVLRARVAYFDKNGGVVVFTSAALLLQSFASDFQSKREFLYFAGNPLKSSFRRANTNWNATTMKIKLFQEMTKLCGCMWPWQFRDGWTLGDGVLIPYQARSISLLSICQAWYVIFRDRLKASSRKCRRYWSSHIYRLSRTMQSQGIVHVGLKRLSYIMTYCWSDEFEEAEWRCSCRLWNVLSYDRDLVKG